MVQLSYPYMTTGKSIALQTDFGQQIKSPLFNALSRLVKAFLPRSMLSGKLELNRGSPNNEKNHKPMKQGAQMRVVPDLVKSAVHVPGENEQPSTWHTHMLTPPSRDPLSCMDVMTAFPGYTGTWKWTGRREQLLSNYLRNPE